MPTHTPSPHRFLAPTHPSTRGAKSTPQSGLRNMLAAETPAGTHGKPGHQFKHLTPAKRFVIPPHRPTHSAGEHQHPPPRPTPRPKPPRKFERVESIEEASQSSPTRPPDDDNDSRVVDSIEHRLFGQEQDDNDDDEMLFVTEQLHKRRRMSPPTSPPTSPPSHHAPRFLLPSPRPPAPPRPSQQPAPTHHRPTFLLPALPAAPIAPPKPLPEIFSPSRKTQKYMPGGLAATMQGYMLEAAGTGDRGLVWGREREHGVRLRLRVTGIGGGEEEVECTHTHMLFARGIPDADPDAALYNSSSALGIPSEHGEMRILLAGQGGARGSSGVKVKVGASVGVKMPVWEVRVGGDMWWVGVEWVVL